MKPWQTEPEVTVMVVALGILGALATLWMLVDSGVL